MANWFGIDLCLQSQVIVWHFQFFGKTSKMVKRFRVNQHVEGATKKFRGFKGQILRVSCGPGRKKCLVRWQNGQENELCTNAIKEGINSADKLQNQPSTEKVVVEESLGLIEDSMDYEENDFMSEDDT